MEKTNYSIIPLKYRLRYSQRLLRKYHNISKILSLHEQESSTAISVENNLHNDLKEDEISIYSYHEYRAKEKSLTTMYVSQTPDFKREYPIHYDTLLYIAHLLKTTDYSLLHNAIDMEINKSDEEEQKLLDDILDNEYTTLKYLRNLLMMREANAKNVEIFFQVRDEDGKRQKDYEVKIANEFDCTELINNRINNIMELIRGNLVPNVSEYKFAGISNDELSSAFVAKLFEPIRSRVERHNAGSRKKSSEKRNFKGLLATVILDYLSDEDLMRSFKKIGDDESRNYNRDGLLLAYHFLGILGLIDIKLLKRHTSRESRIKYMESLPKHTADYRDKMATIETFGE